MLVIQDYDELTSKASLKQSKESNQKIFQQLEFGKTLNELCDGNKITDINEMNDEGDRTHIIKFKYKNIHFLPNKYDYPKYFVKKPITRSASISENGGKIYRKKQKSKKTKKTKKQKKQKRTRKH